MLVHDLLRRGNGSDDAVYSQLGTLTYLGLRVAAENSRRRLYAEGIRRGTRVAVFSRNRAEYIAAALRDDWLHTGDMVRIDERGDVYLAGRRGRLTRQRPSRCL